MIRQDCPDPSAVPTQAGRNPGIQWRIKQSFRDYVRLLDDGCEETKDPALRTNDGFLFPPAGNQQPDTTGTLKFTGTVTFAGHNRMLHVAITNPWIELSGDTAILSITDPTDRTATARMPFATLPELTTSTEKPHDLAGYCPAPELTFEGTYLLGHVYRTGTALDPLIFSTTNKITADQAATSWPLQKEHR
jgi:hypothetical protein